MTDSIMEAIIGAASLKDHCEHAQFGAWKANQNKPVSTYAGRAWVSSQRAKNKPIY
jgi:hypothetical protein